MMPAGRPTKEKLSVFCAHSEMREVAKLVENPRNPNSHPESQIELLAKIIANQGWRNPIVVSERSGFIVKGHGRFQAALKLGVDSVPVDVQEYESEAAEWADMIADNRIAELAEIERSTLKDLLQDMDDGEFDMDLTGFLEDELAEMMSEFAVETEGLTDEDAVPEVPEEPTTKLGQIWKLGRHRLMCGDSTSIDAVDKLMDGRKANMLHTDPPYGVDYEGVPNDHLKDAQLEAFLHDALSCAFTALAPGSNIYVWHADITALEFISAFRSAGFKQARPPTIQWLKPSLTLSQGDYHSQNEPCLYGWKEGSGRVRVKDRKQTTIWKCDRTDEAKVHPTMKPVELCQRAVENSSEVNGIVLDLFGGSGSTLIACEKTARDCRMMELDPKYCDVIIQRWEEFTGKKAELLNDE
jgi:DNA modification methylase